jgi:hypothetical protein
MSDKPAEGDDPGGGKRNPMKDSQPHEGVCGARTRNGTPCQRACVPGRPRCRLHGGDSPAGMDHYSFRHGRRSRYLRDLPHELKAAYTASLKDEELISLRDELAVQTSLIRKRLADLKARQLPPWETVVERLNDLKVAAAEDKPERFAALELAIRTGYDAYQGEREIIDDIRELLQERGRLASIEHRREIDLQMMVPVEAAYAFLTRVMTAIKETITDRDTFRRLNQRVMQLIPAAPPRPNGRHDEPTQGADQN